MMKTVKLSYGYMPLEFRSDRGVWTHEFTAFCFQFGWCYSQTYPGKDYVEGWANELKRGQIPLNKPQISQGAKEQPLERDKFILTQN